MSKEYICKEALGTLFGFGPKALKALVLHAKNHTLPILGLTGRITPMSDKYAMNILPSLAHFFKTGIVPLVGARPTRFTRDAVTQTTIMRDVKDILELDPGVSKRGLYKEYAHLLVIMKQRRNINNKQKFVVGGHFVTTGKGIIQI